MEPTAKIKTISEVAVVVMDLQKAMENCWKIFGIGPWQVYTFDSSWIKGQTYLGKPGNYAAKVAMTSVGPTMFELIQPLRGDDICADFLRERGEGLQHLGVFVDSVDEYVEKFKSIGIGIIESGRDFDVIGGGHYAFMDTQDRFGAIFEPMTMSRFKEPEAVYPSPEEAERVKSVITFKDVSQVAVVVRDIQKAMEDYWRVLGIGPWSVYTYQPPRIKDMMYNGKPVDHALKLALAQVGPVSYELIEPLRGPSTYADFLREHGEGLHHLGFVVDNMQDDIEKLKSAGVAVQHAGRGFGIKGDGGYAYLDTQALVGTTFELISMAEIPAPDAVYPPQR